MVLRRTFGIFLLLILALSLAAPASGASFDEPLSAKNAVLYNVESDKILFEMGIDDTVYPASTAKIMTAVIALEYYADSLDTPIRADGDVVCDVIGNNIALSDGETFTAEQLITAVIVGNANDAALTLAHEISGSVEGFVELMNQKAHELGMTSTVYGNPTGMHHKKMHTTVRDILTLAKYANNMPRFMYLASLKKYQMGEGANKRTIHNRNYMVSDTLVSKYFYYNATGMNVGSTYESGLCAVISAEKGGLKYICVVTGCRYDAENDVMHSLVDSTKLIDFALDNYAYACVIDEKSIISEMPVSLGQDADYVAIMPKSSCETLLPTDIDIKNDIRYELEYWEQKLTAPVESGREVGTISAYFGNELVASTTLIAKNSVKRSGVLSMLSAAGELFSSTPFLIGTALVLLIIVYTVAAAIYRNRYRNRNDRYLR